MENETPETRPAVIDTLRTTPTDVPDAIERIARIKAFGSWLTDVEQPIRWWLTEKALEVEGMTGSAFRTAAADVGMANLSDPQPHARITDPALFAVWYIEEVLALDPHVESDDHVVHFDGHVSRRLTASCDSEDLLRFADACAKASIDQKQLAEAANKLAYIMEFHESWVIGEKTLGLLLAGELHPHGDESRAKMIPDLLRVVDTATGEDVPGLTVDPPARRVLTVTPDKKMKKKVADELTAALGLPVLETPQQQGAAVQPATGENDDGHSEV